MTSSISATEAYREACLDAAISDYAFARFKRHPAYREILEHVTPDQGSQYIEAILRRVSPEEALHLVSRASLVNDQYGGAFQDEYRIGGARISVSPSTLRYCHVFVEIHELLGNLTNRRVCEIGGGYGGQCAVAWASSEFRSWDIVDLPEAGALANRYLDSVGVKNHRHPFPDQIDILHDYDLVISNYAFSECQRPLQEAYATKILAKARHGYMTMNFCWSSRPGYSDLMDEADLARHVPNLKVADENPLTHPGNKVFWW